MSAKMKFALAAATALTFHLAPGGDSAYAQHRLASDTSTSDACAADQTISVNLHDCVAQQLVDADKTLNETYKSVMASLSADKRIELRDAEREWIRRTKKKCDADAAPLQGGSDWPIEYDGCYLTETKAQTAHLRKLAR